MWGFYTRTIQEPITGHICTAVSVLAKATSPAVTQVLNKIKMMQKMKGGQKWEREGVSLHALSRTDNLSHQDSHFRNA